MAWFSLPNHLCPHHCMSNARRAQAHQGCKLLGILGFASRGEGESSPRHDETTQNCRKPGIFTWFSESWKYSVANRYHRFCMPSFV